MLRKESWQSDYKKEKTRDVDSAFKNTYGIMKPALIYQSPFELLVAVVLSAQCTDERVNIVTAGLFRNTLLPKKCWPWELTGWKKK